MKVVITGGAGVIGNHVTTRFVELEHDVTVIDRRKPLCEAVKFIELELQNRQALKPALEGADLVIHLGEIRSVYSGESPQQVYATNCSVGSAVIQASADLKVPHLIYVSSCQVYGHWGGGDVGMRLPFDQIPMDEQQTIRPRNAYALAKVSNEKYAELVSQHQGLSVTVFRFPMVMTETMFQRIAETQRNKTPATDSMLDGLWTFVYIDDVIEAFRLAAERELKGYTAYHFFSPDIVGWIPLKDRVNRFGLKNLDLPANWPAFAAPVSTAKAKRDLGWEARHTWASLAGPVTADSVSCPEKAGEK